MLATESQTRTQTAIVEAGQQLATLNPNADELRQAREWWNAGCWSPRGEDESILSALLAAIEREQAFPADLMGCESMMLAGQRPYELL